MDRVVDQTHPVDVSRAVWKDPPHNNAHDSLGTVEDGQQIAVVVDGRVTVDPHAVRMLEVDDQQADLRVDRDVAQTSEHAVAVVARKRQCARVEHLDESGQAALVRAVGPASASAVARKNIDDCSRNAASPSVSSACTITCSSRSAILRLSKRSCIARAPALYIGCPVTAISYRSRLRR